MTVEAAVAEVVMIVMRLLANKLEAKDQAVALELAADRLKVQAAAQKALDARRR